MARMTLCTKTPSANEKIAEKGSKRIFATYRPTTKRDKDTGELVHKTCPSSCKLLTFCYANAGMPNIQQGNSEFRHDNVTNWIELLPQDAITRHLATGDVFNNDEIDNDYIDETMAGHNARPDVIGYGYTHGWDRLKPEQLNNGVNLTFNASCDTEAEIKTALDAGWDVVKIKDENDAKVEYKGNYKQVQCPAQTVGITCEKCMLCAKHNRRDSNGLPVVIAFAPHGTQKGRVKSAIAAALGDAE